MNKQSYKFAQNAKSKYPQLSEECIKNIPRFYKTNKISIPLECTIHDCIFEQRPDNLMNSYLSCKKCLFEKDRIKQATIFINKATKIHSNKYGYDQVVQSYQDQLTPVPINCPTHGIFPQRPHNHIHQKQGCPECCQNAPLSTKKIIEKGREIHGDKYDYGNLNFKRGDIRIAVTCLKKDEDGDGLIHGDFYPRVNDFLSKESGCPKPSCCEKFMNMTKEILIQRFLNVFGDIYNYDLVEYKTVDDHVNIICPIHGIFEKTPKNHLLGRGCPSCSCGFKSSKAEIEWLTVLETELKIDIQGNHSSKYSKQFRIESPIKGKYYDADGYYELLKIIFEFHGCWFHGCETCFPNRKSMNTLIKKTYEELFNKTKERTSFLREKGYTVIEIWECEWKHIHSNSELLKHYIQSLIKYI